VANLPRHAGFAPVDDHEARREDSRLDAAQVRFAQSRGMQWFNADDAPVSSSLF